MGIFDSRHRNTNNSLSDVVNSQNSLHEHQFSVFFENAFDAMVITDDEGIYVEVNQCACELFKRSRNELLGCKIVDFAEPGFDFVQVWQEFQQQGQVRGEFRLILGNGSVRVVEYAATANFFPHRHLLILRDITERKQTETKIQRLNQELKQQVQERTNELTQATVFLKGEIEERQRAEDLLRLSESRYKAVVESQTELICRFLPDGTLSFVNAAYCRYFNKTINELIGENFLTLVSDASDDRIVQQLAELNALTPDHPVILQEYSIITADGKTEWQQWVNSAIFDQQGCLIEFQAVGRDITAHKRSEIELIERNQQLLTLHNISEITINAPSLSSAFQNIVEEIRTTTRFPIVAIELYDKSRQVMIFAASKGIVLPPNIKALEIPVNETLSGTVAVTGQAIVKYYQPNEPKTCDANETLCQLGIKTFICLPMKVEQQILGTLSLAHSEIVAISEHFLTWITSLAGYIASLTERKRSEEQLVHNALHDALTNLPNRNLLMERLKLSINKAQRQDSYNFAVLFLDLDRFKIINDSLGHSVGDQLLIIVALKLSSAIRAMDLAARLGGDEFVILLEDIENISKAVQIAERILAEFQKPLMLEGREVFVMASIGLVFGGKNYTQAADLLRDADIALYKAKAKGRAKYEIFDAKMHTQAIQRLHLENDLRKAIEDQQFIVHYQPIIALPTSELIGVEALVRWQHPTRGLIYPGEFIAVAEETGLIILLDYWVLQAACEQLAKWKTHFPFLRMSVNLSVQDLWDIHLIEKVTQILANTGLNGHFLTLEITESMLIENVEATIDLLTQLKKLGIQVSIDDFGTGYSSLSYLPRLPVDMLKIDRAFVSQMQENDKNYDIVKTIITLSNQLGLNTIAEGIETQQQLDRLQQLGCELGQGYWFSKPLSPQNFLEKYLG